MPTQREIMQDITDLDWKVIADVGDFHWEYVPNFPVSEFLSKPLGGMKKVDTKKSYGQWIEDERASYPSYFNKLEAAWVENPEAVGPVVIAYVPGGRIDIGDGWHRIGFSIVNDMETIPALVGTPRRKVKFVRHHLLRRDPFTP